MKSPLPPPVNTTTGEPSWRWRRVMAFGIVAFCCFIIGFGSSAADTKINETIATSAFWLLGIIFLLYGGYSTFQDVVAIWTTRSARPYSDAPPPTPVDHPPPAVVVVQEDRPTPPEGFVP